MVLTLVIIYFFLAVYLIAKNIYFDLINNNRKYSFEVGIQSQLDQIEYRENKLNKIKSNVSKLIKAIETGLSWPFKLIIKWYEVMVTRMFKKENLSDAYLYLRPRTIFFNALLLISTLILAYFKIFHYQSNIYLNLFLIINLLVVILQFLRWILFPDFYMNNFARSIYNLRGSIILLSSLLYLIMFISLFAIFRYSTPFTIQNVLDFNSNLLGFKEIRLYFYNVLDKIDFDVLLISGTGFLFSITVANNLKRIITSSRKDFDIFKIVDKFLILHEFEKGKEWLEKIKDKKQENYWFFKSMFSFGEGEIFFAKKYWKRAQIIDLNEDTTDDLVFISLLTNSSSYNFDQEIRNFHLEEWYHTSKNRLFLCIYLIGVLQLKKDFEHVEYIVSLNPKKRHNANIKKILDFKDNFIETGNYKNDIRELNGNSKICDHLNIIMRCYKHIFTYLNKPDKSLLKECEIEFERMRLLFDEREEFMYHYFTFTSLFSFGILTKMYNLTLFQIVNDNFILFKEELEKHERITLLNVFNMRNSFQQLSSKIDYSK